MENDDIWSTSFILKEHAVKVYCVRDFCFILSSSKWFQTREKNISFEDLRYVIE